MVAALAVCPKRGRGGFLARGFRDLALVLPLVGLLGFLAAALAWADETGLTPEFMSDPANIDLGQGLFKQQCVKCHGKGAYPGKAPKLKKLSPEDIYLRVTYGYGRMPAWEHVFTDDERMAITAYMKSPHFSN
jgi:mono/diheme cytochrome c family protein